MTTIKIRDVGNSLGVVLPKELIARLRVSKGDKLFVQETVDGIRLTPYDPDFQQQMEIAQMVMHEDRDALSSSFAKNVCQLAAWQKRKWWRPPDKG